jgi:hypothetical protein
MDESKMKPMFLPGVEGNPQPGPYRDLIQAMQATRADYPQIWHMFAYLPKATEQAMSDEAHRQGGKRMAMQGYARS